MSPSTVDTFADRVRVVLVRPLQSGNIGSAARAMKNMGLRELVIVAPVDFDIGKARMMAPGAADILESARFCDSVHQAIADTQLVVGTTARGRRFRWPILEPGDMAVRVLENPERSAILFGPEDSGLSNEDLLLCHSLIHIPTDLHSSLNLAQAVLIVAYELFNLAVEQGYEPSSRVRRSRRGHRSHPAEPKNWLNRVSTEPATVDHMLVVAERGHELLSMTSYLLGRNEDQIRSTLYQWLQRLAPSVPEYEVMLGMAAKLKYALEHAGAIPPRRGSRQMSRAMLAESSKQAMKALEPKE